MKTILTSEIKSPYCAFTKVEQMPIDSCQILYNCTGYNQEITPKNEDCCVYCTYGTVPCPPIQENKNCCK